jgi:LuxR family maltose regulon positive regulatory protein
MAADVAGQESVRSRRPAPSGAVPILASKITVPRVPDWAVPRSRITRLVAEGTRWCPLTVVTGPAGAGKTMALALWAAAEPGPVAWVSLDDYDNRPGMFWPYVAAALRRSGVEVPLTLPAGRGRAVDHAVLLQLALVLAAQDPPVTLVLDDLHLLTDARVLDGLDYMLRNVGPGLRLVVSSRMDPLLPLHRYRMAGQLAEIRAGDLAFSVPETGELVAQHGVTLSADGLECLTQRTEGWAAGIRLAAISMSTHPEPDQFVKELVSEDSAVTGYLVGEVLNAQPPEVRDVLLNTSILEHVSADAASELAGNEQAAEILPALARANAFVQPIGRGWYRYHTLFAEVLRLKLRYEHPDRMPGLHRRAARWCEQRGSLTDAVVHAAEAGDWALAADMVINGLAISELIEPRGSQALTSQLRHLPRGRAWTGPQPYLVSAALALADGRVAACAAALAEAERVPHSLTAGQQAAARLAAALIRLAAARRTGDIGVAAAAADEAEALISELPGGTTTRQLQIRARVLAGRGAVELWRGHLGAAAQVLESGVAAASAPGAEHERADCLGLLALVEALRGQLRLAAQLAAQSTGALTADGRRPSGPRRSPGALVALAWVHLEHNEPRDARKMLKQARVALEARPDMLVAALAQLVTAGTSLAEDRPAVTAQALASARYGWTVPAWIEQRLNLVESRAALTAGDTEAALAAAERAGKDGSPEAAAALAHAWHAIGNPDNAWSALAPALAAGSEVPESTRVQAWLAQARLSYAGGDPARGRRALASALRLAEPERLGLPFALERGRIDPVLRHDPELARAYRHLVTPVSRHQPPTLPGDPAQAGLLVLEPLTERELEVLRHVSTMLKNSEVASEMYISINTVKSHVRSICRKLAATHRGEAVRRARELELI